MFLPMNHCIMAEVNRYLKQIMQIPNSGHNLSSKFKKKSSLQPKMEPWACLCFACSDEWATFDLQFNHGIDAGDCKHVFNRAFLKNIEGVYRMFSRFKKKKSIISVLLFFLFICDSTPRPAQLPVECCLMTHCWSLSVVLIHS